MIDAGYPRKILNPNKASALSLGRSGEDVALGYLLRKKYKVVARHFRMFRGEIDIVAYDRKILVFVEVKTRRSREFGLPEESVTPAKQRQIRKIAQGFLAKNRLANIECRFDVISLELNGEGYSVRHIKDAF